MANEDANEALPEQWKHGRLHEFQALLLARMEAARDGSGMRDSRLGVLIGDKRCLLDLREASEIVSLMPMARVPLTKDWYLGLANVRGNLIGIVDLQRFLGGALLVPEKDSRVIVVSSVLSGAGAGGFLVSKVLGLRNLKDMTSQDGGKEETRSEAGTRYLDGDMQAWTEISLAAVVDDPRFLYVGL